MHRYKDLVERELVEHCVAGDRSAWNEFFRRFTPLIRKTIHKIIRRFKYVGPIYQSKTVAHVTDLSQRDGDGPYDSIGRSTESEYAPGTNEAEEEIYCNVVIKLYKGALRICKNYADVQPWLVVVAGNASLDWLKSQITIDHRPSYEAERSMRSLDEPLGEDAGYNLESVLVPENDTGNDKTTAEDRLDAQKERLRSILQELSGLKNRKTYWILRLSILGEELLDDEEMLALSLQAKRSVPETLEKVQAVLERVYGKKLRAEQKRQRAAALTVLLHSQENELCHARSGCDAARIAAIEKKCARTREIRDKSMRASQIECRPSNRELIELMALPESEEKDISVLLLRTRKRLKGLCKRASNTSRGI